MDRCICTYKQSNTYIYAYNIYIQYIIHTLIYTMSYIHTYCIVFNHLYSASRSLSLSEVFPTTVIDTVSEFIRHTPKCYRQLQVKDLPKDLTARTGFEPMTLWSKGIDSTNAPPRPTYIYTYIQYYTYNTYLKNIHTYIQVIHKYKLTYRHIYIQCMYVYITI